jgi:drug/metabolite transporter (DMT)-like permease
MLAVLSAVVASIGYGVSTIMQAVATRRTAGLAVVTQPLVIGAFVVDGLAWLLSLVALDRLPLFVVQAVIASSLVVVVVLARFVLGTRMRAIDRVAVVVVVGALVVVSLSGGDQPAVAPPDGFVTTMLVSAGVLAAVFVLAYRRGRPLLLATIAGLGYSAAAVAARAAHASGGLLDTVLQPLAIVIVVSGVVAALAYLRALERGSVGAVAATVSVLEVVVPGIAGMVVLGDVVRHGWDAAAVLGTAAALAGCIALAMSPANTAAEAAQPV